MKRLFGALVVTGMLLGVTASHQILAGANNNDEVCVCAPFINEVRSNGIVLLLGEVKCVPRPEVLDVLAEGGVLMSDPAAMTLNHCCGVCRDQEGDEAPCPPID